MKLLALDFDGVISDSAGEAFEVALRTYRELHPETALQGSDALQAAFLEHMPLGNRAEDFGVVLRALEARAPLPDQAAYDRFRDALEPGWLRDFHKRFYRVRAAFSRAEPERWRALMGPYSPLLELLRRRAGDAELAIATAKDRRSVRELLGAYGVADLFPEGRVLDKETGVSKSAHMEHLARELGFAFAEITFVDDKVNHLDSVAPLGVRCGLAAWGYNGAREVALARAQGYLVLELADAEEQLFG